MSRKRNGNDDHTPDQPIPVAQAVAGYPPNIQQVLVLDRFCLDAINRLETLRQLAEHVRTAPHAMHQDFGGSVDRWADREGDALKQLAVDLRKVSAG